MLWLLEEICLIFSDFHESHSVLKISLSLVYLFAFDFFFGFSIFLFMCSFTYFNFFLQFLFLIQMPIFIEIMDIYKVLKRSPCDMEGNRDIKRFKKHAENTKNFDMYTSYSIYSKNFINYKLRQQSWRRQQFSKNDAFKFFPSTFLFINYCLEMNIWKS